MKDWNGTKIIGVDHGYGNIKTANCCFKNSILGYDSEPLFTSDMLVYDGRYYLIGEGHKEFLQNKVQDEDYYMLTLVGIAKELALADLTEAHICIAAGLPLTWTSGQKEAFKAYLSRNKEVRFTRARNGMEQVWRAVPRLRSSSRRNRVSYHNEHRIWPYQILSPQRSWLRTSPRGMLPLNTPSKKGLML